ncbi:MAG: GC-type dockerin domain-anchored protein, partial [Planctomycetota bacterium]
VDADGSGRAWLTDIDTGTTNSDVDNGTTTLTSPTLDAPAGSQIEFSYWFNDIPGGPADNDALVVQVSEDDGASFATVRTVTTVSSAWRSDTLVAGVDYQPSSTVRLRFSASDGDPQGVIEAGIDAIVISARTCVDPSECLADSNNDGVVNPADFNAWVIAFNNQASECDQNGDGLCNPADFNAWVINFNAGCD